MIRTSAMLLRIAQEFFRTDLVGLYGWDRDVRIAAPELREPIPSNIDRIERRRLMAAREGLGRYLEQERLAFGPWEILIYSAAERGPLGEVSLRLDGAVEVTGPLDAATWSKIGARVRDGEQRSPRDVCAGEGKS